MKGKQHYSTGNGQAYCGSLGGELTLYAMQTTCKRCRRLVGDLTARDADQRSRERTR